MKVKITIPESLEDITLGQYQEFQTVLEHNENDANDDLVRKKMVQIFCKVPLSVVDRMKQVDFLEAVRRVTEVLNEKTKLVNVVDLHGVKLGFIPKLDDITAGEFADLSNYLGDVKNLHKAMAVLYRPIKGKVDRLGKYLIQEYEGTNQYSEAMKQLPMNIVQGSMLFFWALKIELLQATLGEKWGWYQSFHTVAGGDYFKIKDVAREKLHSVLYFLAYEIDKTKLK